MKLRLVGIVLPTFLASCSAPKGPSLTLLVQKPSGTDDSCLGVVGFEVEVSTAGKMSPSGPILNTAAVQMVEDCRLARPFTIDGVDPDRPATVTVHGYDGAHQARLGGTADVGNLRSDSAMIQLKVEGAPAPPLILNRRPLLGTIASLSDVDVMTIATAKGGQPVTLLSVRRSDNPAWFDVDPGGFGVEIQNGEMLTIDFTFPAGGPNLPRLRVITALDTTGPVFRTQP
jgi:hypothetical protein